MHTKKDSGYKILNCRAIFSCSGFKFLNLKSKILNLATVFGLVAVAGLFFFASANTIYAAFLAKPPNNLGLVGYWSFNDEGRSIAGDFSGQGNDGALTLMDVTTDWVTGKYGSALDFDAVNDYVDVSVPLGNTYTISMWINETNSDGYGALAVEDNTLGFFYRGTTNRIVYFNGSDRSSNTDITSGWHHVAMTFSAGNVVLYLDGVEDGTHSSLTDESLTLEYIGSNNLTEAFGGNIDEVRVYSRVLTGDEITALYESGQVKIGSSRTNEVSNGLAAHWTLDAQDTNWSTQTLSDASGNSYTGTIVNTSTSTAPRPGLQGQALDFDGSNDYISGGNLNLGNTFTITLWAYADQYTYLPDIDDNNIWGQNTGNPWQGSNIGALYVRDNLIRYWQGGSARITGSDAKVNSWNMYTLVGDASGVTLYHNGELVGTYGTPVTYNNDIFFAHGGSGTDEDYWNGRMDDIRIYDRPLSADEVKRLYNIGAGTQVQSSSVGKLDNGLVGHWTFDGQHTDWSNHTTQDLSGNFYTGTTTDMGTTTGPALGRIGQGFRFYGQEPGEVEVRSFNHGIGTGDFTVSLHAKVIAPTTAGYQGFMGIDTFDPGFVYYRLSPSDEWGLYDGGDYDSGSSLELNEWYHLVVRRTGTDLEFFRDGVLEPNSYTYTDSIDNGRLRIGRVDGSDTRAINGIVDDVRVYNRSLSLDEIQRLYRMGGGN